MRIAIVGCGYVADYYISTFPNYPELEVVGVMDRDALRARAFAKFWKIPRVYPSLEDLLNDPQVAIVLNCTNPSSHYAVSRACLIAGKHVYSEKPLSMVFEEAEELVGLAEERGLSLSGAPCSVLGEAAQTTWKALRQGIAGKVRLVYAELDEGMLHLMNFREWTSPSGIRWPNRDEFEVGSAIEHAGYYVTWLAAFFGPARRVTAYASCQVPEKDSDVAPDRIGPDFSVGMIEFASGVVARLTCSLVATHDHALRIFGDAGVLSCEDGWIYSSPVRFVRFEVPLTPGRRAVRIPPRSKILNAVWTFVAPKILREPGPTLIPPVREARFQSYPRNGHHMDFARGIAEQAEALRENRACRLSARFMLHVNEVVLALQPAQGASGMRTITSTFEPIAPMPWAEP
jgi:predicted dehydrogenase